MTSALRAVMPPRTRWRTNTTTPKNAPLMSVTRGSYRSSEIPMIPKRNASARMMMAEAEERHGRGSDPGAQGVHGLGGRPALHVRERSLEEPPRQRDGQLRLTMSEEARDPARHERRQSRLQHQDQDGRQRDQDAQLGDRDAAQPEGVEDAAHPVRDRRCGDSRDRHGGDEADQGDPDEVEDAEGHLDTRGEEQEAALALRQHADGLADGPRDLGAVEIGVVQAAVVAVRLRSRQIRIAHSGSLLGWRPRTCSSAS